MSSKCIYNNGTAHGHTCIQGNSCINVTCTSQECKTDASGTHNNGQPVLDHLPLSFSTVHAHIMKAPTQSCVCTVKEGAVFYTTLWYESALTWLHKLRGHCSPSHWTTGTGAEQLANQPSGVKTGVSCFKSNDKLLTQGCSTPDVIIITIFRCWYDHVSCPTILARIF